MASGTLLALKATAATRYHGFDNTASLPVATREGYAAFSCSRNAGVASCAIREADGVEGEGPRLTSTIKVHISSGDDCVRSERCDSRQSVGTGLYMRMRVSDDEAFSMNKTIQVFHIEDTELPIVPVLACSSQSSNIYSTLTHDHWPSG